MDKVIGFYSRPKTFYSCLSNFHRVKVVVDGEVFNSSEHYYMYQKAFTFDPNGDVIKEMTVDKSLMLLKELGQIIPNFDAKIWDKKKEAVMYKGCLAKFSQNEDIKEILLSTGTAILAECSPEDRIWGIGLEMDNPDIQDISKWQGDNLLGKVLMRVREELANVG